MTLAPGDICTVVYADGGVRVALPIEVAAGGQTAYLADFGVSGQGVPLRIRSVAEIAAIVPEVTGDPRLQRVIGTIVRDASQTPLFVPLGVMPHVAPTPTPASTFFVVFADTGPIQVSTTTSPHSFYRRTPGEYDLFIETTIFSTYTTVHRHYATAGISPSLAIPGAIIERFTIPNVTVFEREVTYSTGVVVDRITSANVAPGSQRTIALSGPVLIFSYDNTSTYFVATPTGVSVHPLGVSQPRRSEITWESDDVYFTSTIAQVRNNFNQWDALPTSLVYHLPLSSDARPGTLNEILPTGATDIEPLQIIRDGYPSAADVVARIAAAASEEGVREVRFFTSMATVIAANRVTALIDEIVGALQAAYGEIVHTTTVAPGNDWLGALAESAEDIPGDE